MELFGEVEDALDSTWEIAQRCQVKLEKIKEPFPKFDVPAGAHHRHVLRVRGARRASSAAARAWNAGCGGRTEAPICRSTQNG